MMRIFRDIRLLELARAIEAEWPKATVGWDLALTNAGPDDSDTLLEVFSIEDDEELRFLDSILPLVRDAERDLGLRMLVLSHDLDSTRELYASIPDRIKAWRETLATWDLSVRWTLDRLTDRRAA